MENNKSNIEYYKESIRAIRNTLKHSIKNKSIYDQLTREEIARLNELEIVNLSNAIELVHEILDCLLLENACKNQAYFFIIENDLLNKFARYCGDNPTENFYH